MLKILEAYLVGLGHETARFNPLKLTFCDVEDKPAHTLLSLRNGGGKTSLLSLFFAHLLPSRREFLGQLNSRNASLEDYVRSGETGYLISRWEMVEEGTTRRIIGMIALRKGARVETTLFSFFETEYTVFGDLPVPGLGSGSTVSSARFLERLRELGRTHPKIDLFITTKKGAWRQHLEHLGFSVSCWVAQLRMNRQEGGAMELFNFQKPEQFTRQFLELIWDEEAEAAPTESYERDLDRHSSANRQLKAYQEKHERRPEKEQTQQFVKRLLEVLQPFSNYLTQEQKAHVRLEQLATTCIAWKIALGHQVKILQGRFEQLEEELKQSKQTEKILAGDLKMARRRVQGYQELQRGLRFEEAKSWVLASQDRLCQAQLLLKTAEAGIALRRWRDAQADFENQQRRKENLLAQFRPQLEVIRSKGAFLWTIGQNDLTKLKEVETTARKTHKRTQETLKKMRQQQIDAIAAIARLETDQASVRGRLEDYNKEKKRLRVAGSIERDETGVVALDRIQLERSDIETRRDNEISLYEKTKGRQRELTKERTEIEETRRIAESKLKKLKDIFESYEQKRQELAKDAVLCDLVGSSIIDPYNYTLKDLLNEAVVKANQNLSILVVACAQEQRDLVSLETTGLMAPSHDLEHTLALLEEEGIDSALSFYRWLSDSQPGPDAARDYLKKKPYLANAIVIQSKEQYLRAVSRLRTASIKSTVLLANGPDSKLWPEWSKDFPHVIWSESDSLFSARSAELERPQLEIQLSDQEAQQNSIRDEINGYNKVLNELNVFLEEFPQDRIKTFRESLSSAEANFQGLDERCKGIEEELMENAGERDDLETRIQEKNVLINQYKLSEAEIDSFIRQHESKAEGWIEKDIKLGQQISSQTTLKNEADSSVPNLSTLVDTKRNDVFLTEQSRQNFENELEGLNNHYIGKFVHGEGKLPVESFEIIHNEWLGDIESYEGRVKDSDLESKLIESRTLMGERKKEYEKIDISDIESDAIEAVAENSDCQSARTAAEEENESARDNKARAEAELELAKKDPPRVPRWKEGADLDPSVTRPETAEGCELVIETFQSKADGKESNLISLRSGIEELKGSYGRVERNLPLYRAMIKRLPDDVDDEGAHPVVLEGDPNVDEPKFEDAVRGYDQEKAHLDNIRLETEKHFQNQIDPLIRSEEGDEIAIKTRLSRLNFIDWKQNLESHRSALDDQLQVLNAELEQEEADRQMVLKVMLDLGEKAKRLLRHAESVSKMPDGAMEWAGIPFVKVNVPSNLDSREASLRLDILLRDWLLKKIIPEGADLAFQCLLSLCGDQQIHMRVLKPEVNFRAKYHDILDLRKFSDGEKMTAAILLYCILVRLRVRESGQSSIFANNAGTLILDNPLGRANLTEFVRLQLMIAQLMGVQLVYASGIEDDNTLAQFPHCIRLRNNTINRNTGDAHVRHEQVASVDANIEAIVLGKRQGSKSKFDKDSNVDSKKLSDVSITEN